MGNPPSPSPEALALLDDAACGLLQTADDGIFLRVNRTFCTWLGRPAEALVGRRRLQDLLTMGGRIFHQTHWSPLLSMQGSLSEVKLELVHADGTAIPMILNAVRHQRGGAMVHEVAAYVARDRDKYERELVLSRKRLEELVAESKRLQAAANDRALLAEQMIGIVSHDLRNPMSSIQVGAALLARGELSASQHGIVNRITRSVGRASGLIADLLDFTQARLGRALSVTLAPIDLHAVVCEAVDELGFAYAGRVLMHQRVGEGACSADANRLAQLIGNLVSNAMTYGAAGTPVTVTSTIADATFGVAVHNLGPPISQATQAHIFEPMSRGTDTSSPDRSVGLGLFIVREIAKSHGGDARVESTADAGTTFFLVFPRR